MRKIPLPATLTENEEQLVARGRAKAEEHIAAFLADPTKPIKTDSLYREFKPILLRTHNGKCAYCETDIIRNDGDVEHFRPKQGVLDREGKVAKMRLDTGAVIDHPGYFWLAYDLRNLFLSCQHCNQIRNHVAPDGSGDAVKFGKGCYFPLTSTYGYCLDLDKDPDEAEKRLLIDPRKDNFLDDIELLDNGYLRPKTDRGEFTIKRLGLNEQNLPELRYEAIQVGRSAVTGTLHSLARDDEDAEFKAKRVMKIFTEELPYTLAYWHGVKRAKERLSEVFSTEQFYALMQKIARRSANSGPGIDL